ncbi:MAG: hypothetical protein OXN26_19870 [Gammaproteobacteria bacterium]|nr:hypothetical protein [Gammaproteobacteria bacterium]
MIKKLMNPFTIGTLLNSAPMIIQAAGKLVDLIKEREQGAPTAAEKVPVTLDNLEEIIGRLHARLDSMDEASVEQLRLIEQLARQNEALADSLQRQQQRTTFAFILALIGLLLAILGLTAAA